MIKATDRWLVCTRSGAQKLASFRLPSGGPTMDMMAPKMDEFLNSVSSLSGLDLHVPKVPRTHTRGFDPLPPLFSCTKATTHGQSAWRSASGLRTSVYGRFRPGMATAGRRRHHDRQGQ